MFKSFNNFTKEIYEDTSDKMKEMYKSEAKHRISYLANAGFDDWLKSMKDVELTKSQLNSVVQTYVKFGGRTAADIPFVIQSIDRGYGIQIPVEEGIATKEYWEEKLDSSSELVK